MRSSTPTHSVKEAQKSVNQFFNAPPEITGSIFKRFDARYAHSWKGMEIKPGSSTQRIASPMRWKEYSEGRRTLDTSIPAKTSPIRLRKPPAYMSERNTVNMQDMIMKGYGGEEIGSMSSRVAREGKVYYGLSGSFDNAILSQSLKEVYKKKDAFEHTGIQIEKKAKRTIGGVEHLKDSQLVILPGTARDVREPTKPAKIPPFVKSQIDILPGVIKPSPPSPQTPDIKKPLSRGMLTTLQREELMGRSPDKTQKRMINQPKSIDIMNNTLDILAKSRPSDSISRGRDIHHEVGFGISPRQTGRSSSRGSRPEGVRDLLKSSFKLS